MSIKIEALLAQKSLVVLDEFIPFSRSRNASADPDGKHPGKRSLNWRVTLVQAGRNILTTEYSAGIAHAPSYKKAFAGGYLNTDGAADLIYETEQGMHAPPKHRPVPIAPNALDVIHSLILDAEAIDHPTFEDWASDLGLDSDSRKAEATYRACLEIGLKLRSGIGESALSELREAFRDY